MDRLTSFPPLLDAWYLTGATAAGKTSIGLELAKRIGAEIISLDSMAVYRGMDIGTAKPTVDQRAELPHHLIDVVLPTDQFSVSEYLTAAHRCAADIAARGKEVLFVGGTSLYLKALLHGLCDGPEADWELRGRLTAVARESGPEFLHDRLKQLDPQAATRLHPHDTRRLVRAIEVFEKTGRPMSQYQQHFQQRAPADKFRVFVVDWPRPELHRRINARVDNIFQTGLIGETEQLLKKYGTLGRTARQAIGYCEVMKYLDQSCELSEALLRTKARTRQLARRQLIWLRALVGCHWLDRAALSDPNQIAAKIVNLAD